MPVNMDDRTLMGRREPAPPPPPRPPVFGTLNRVLSLLLYGAAAFTFGVLVASEQWANTCRFY